MLDQQNWTPYHINSTLLHKLAKWPNPWRINWVYQKYILWESLYLYTKHTIWQNWNKYMKHIVKHRKQDRWKYAKVLSYTKLSLVLAILWPHGRKSQMGGRGLMKSVTKKVWLHKSELRLLVLFQMVTPSFLKYTTTVGGCCAGTQCSATFLWV